MHEDQAISIVVPVYNAKDTLRPLVETVQKELGNLIHEIVLVNDGSTDQSWETIEELASTYPQVRGIDLGRNYGQHNALLCGIRAAAHETVVTMDDDLQNPPREIRRLIAGLDNSDVVYGYSSRQQHGLARRLASRVTKLALQRAMRVENATKVSSFRAFRTQLRDAFSGYSGSFVSIDVLLTWATSSFGSVEVDHDERSTGESGYSTGMLITHALNLITGFSVLPLQLASLLGFLLVIFGVLVLLYVLGRWALFGSSVAGLTFLATIITLFAGAQLFALGVIGEYLARVHFRALDRPPYVVNTTT